MTAETIIRREACSNNTADLPAQSAKKFASTMMTTLKRRAFPGKNNGVLKCDVSSYHSRSTATEETYVEKFVSFSTQASMRYTMPLSSYTPAEIEGTWYSDKENSDIARQCSKQILKMDRGEILKDKKYCSRGLESHTRTGSKIKTLHRALSIDAVLDVQGQLWDEGIRDEEEAIAGAYAEATASSQMWANVIGLRDQREAEDYLDTAFESTILPCDQPPSYSSSSSPGSSLDDDSIVAAKKVISARTA